MIPETQSGVPDDDDYSPSRVIALAGDGASLALFALLCAGRVGALVERFGEPASMRFTVHLALELGWTAVINVADAETISRAISDLDRVVSSGHGDLGRYHGYLDDAVSTVAYALEVVRDGRETAAINVVERCREIAFQIAQQLWPTMSLKGLESSPIVTEEVIRQVRDAQRAAALVGRLSPDLLADLRDQVHAEGDGLADIIGGEKMGREEGAEAVEQPPLF